MKVRAAKFAVAIVATVLSGANLVAAPDEAEPATDKCLTSPMMPSAFSPSTSTIRTVVGVIDTPSTMSTDPSKMFATLVYAATTHPGTTSRQLVLHRYEQLTRYI